MRLSKFIFLAITVALTVAISWFIFREKMTEKVKFKTSDGVEITANLYKVDKPLGWLILSHMMPADKDSWRNFAKKMQEIGYESLAIDLRGHGESDGGSDGFSNFTDEQHQASINDIDAAWEFLELRGALPEKTFLVGASFGANLSIWFLAEHQQFGGGIFLSAGNYKGIDSLVYAKKIKASQKVLFVSSIQDNRSNGNNADSNREYFKAVPDDVGKRLIIFEGLGHGTDLFNLKKELDLMEAIKKFLQNE